MSSAAFGASASFAYSGDDVRHSIHPVMKCWLELPAGVEPGIRTRIEDDYRNI